MKLDLNKLFTLLAAFMLVFAALSSCASDGVKEKAETLPPVVTQGLDETEDPVSSIELDGYTVVVYETYCEILLYEGEETELAVPDAFMGIPVKKIGERAFYGNEKLLSVKLPDKLIKLDNSAFEACVNLKTVAFGSQLEEIGPAAFKDTALEEAKIPETVVTLGRYSFYRTAIKTVTVPDGVKNIGKYAFYGCKSLESVTLSARTESVSEYAFGDCVSLKTVVIPESAKVVGDYCFKNCTSLEKIYIPKKASVGENAFLQCKNVTIYTPKGSYAETWAKKYGFNYKKCGSADKM